jgi:NhaP-type Na+/H+ and K+/H+ antiporter
VIGGRMIAIYLTTAPLQLKERFKEEFNNKERIFIGFTGMKGLTTGVLAMIAFIELSKFKNLVEIAEIMLYSSILVIIFTGIIQAVFLKKLAKKTDVLDNFKLDELDIIKGQKLVLEASLNFIEDEIKENNIQLRDLRSISIPLREELYSLREHIARLRSEQNSDLQSLQLGLQLNKLAQNSLLNFRYNDEIKESTYQTILGNLLAEKTNIELYIKSVELKDKIDPLEEVDVINEDLDIIEDEITVLESNQAPNKIIEALEKIKPKLKKHKDIRPKTK